VTKIASPVSVSHAQGFTVGVAVAMMPSTIMHIASFTFFGIRAQIRERQHGDRPVSRCPP
jgi:hypothetical protein